MLLRMSAKVCRFASTVKGLMQRYRLDAEMFAMGKQ